MKSKKTIIIAIIAVAIAAFVALLVHNYKTKTSFKYRSTETSKIKPAEHSQDKVSAAVNDEAASLEAMRKNSEVLKISSSDFVLGDKNAPVTIVEYASLSCPHCAAFTRESFDRLKEEYIDSGKVKFIYRDFPLNQQALVAAMFAICQAEDNKDQLPEKYYSTVKALLKTQDSWAFDEAYAEKLEAIARLDGMSQERFKSCIANEALQKRILQKRMDAAKSLQLKSTPSFFVNGEISEGYVDYRTIKELIDKKLNQAN